MDGIHDLGGKHGFGRLDIDDLPAGFQRRWHAAVFSMVNVAFASGAARNTDHFRHSIERIDPVCYLTHGYYGRWLGGLENLLVEGGVITQAELDQRARSLGAGADAQVAARPQQTGTTPVAPQSPPARNASARRTPSGAARYASGAHVRTSNHGSAGHTRLPAYARGAQGEIAAYQGMWVLPDVSAHGGEAEDHLYSVRFTAQSLFGDQAQAADEVYLDLFESYLEAAEA